MIDEELVLKMAQALYGARGVARAFSGMNMGYSHIRRLSPRSVTNLVFGNKQGEVYVSPFQSCHAGLQIGDSEDSEDFLKGGILHVLSGIQREFKGEEETNATAFYEWLVNDSPWRRVFLTRNGVEAVECGFLVTKANVPANFLASALIASRLPTELDPGAKDWAFYANQGAGPALAFLCRHELVRKIDGTISGSGMVGHSCYSSGSMSKSEIREFISGEIPNKDKFKENYDEILYYRDVDVLMSKATGSTAAPFIFKKVLGRLSEKLGSSSSNSNPFANPGGQSASINQKDFPQFVEALREELDSA